MMTLFLRDMDHTCISFFIHGTQSKEITRRGNRSKQDGTQYHLIFSLRFFPFNSKANQILEIFHLIDEEKYIIYFNLFVCWYGLY